MQIRNTFSSFNRLHMIVFLLIFLPVVTIPLVFLTSRLSSNVASISVISRNVPAFASSEAYPASNANSDDYDKNWNSNGFPAWLAYNLSGVPASQRGKVLVVWYNETGNYDHTVSGDNAYDIPQDYTIDVNPAKGGNPPSTGWKTLVTVKGNHFHSRQAVLDMTGNNWLRINVTAVDGTDQNYDAALKMDVYDASHGTDDDWIFYGASIFAEAMNHRTAGKVKTFAQLINDRVPTEFPAQESGGIGFLTSGDGAQYVPKWLPMFPGKYVGLGYGTNDALGCADPTEFYNNYVTMVQAILRAGKVPWVQKILWGPNVENCAPPLNAKIEQLYKAFPQVIPGPDAWTYFQNHPKLISDDRVHPTEEGAGALRQLWADTAIATIYSRNGSISTPTSMPKPAATPTSPLAASPTPPPLFSGLRVSGNKLVNSEGQMVVLHGINRSGAEYACIQGWDFMDGPGDAASVQAIASWKTNAVRVLLNEDCWLNINNAPAQYSGSNYQHAIVNYVNLLNQYGLYVVLALISTGDGTLQSTKQQPMPDRDHAPDFWKSVATTFKGNTKVIFDIFGEPFPDDNQDTTAGWQCWKDGGACVTRRDTSTPYVAAGMQELVTAVRGTGATNVIMLGGIQFSNALSQWLTYKPVDPLNNLAASWHVYPGGNSCNTTSCYDSIVAPVANQVPLITGEVGEGTQGDVCGVDGTNIVLNWLDKHNASYLAWTWDTWGTSCADLSLITSYDGTPKSPNGTNYKNHLAALAGNPAQTSFSSPTKASTPYVASALAVIPSPNTFAASDDIIFSQAVFLLRSIGSCGAAIDFKGRSNYFCSAISFLRRWRYMTILIQQRCLGKVHFKRNTM